MKRCPECDSVFPDTEHYCELDGTPLEVSDDAYNFVVNDKGAEAPRSVASRSLLPIVAVGGVILGVLLFLVYFAMTRKTSQENSNHSTSNSSVAQQQTPLPQLRSAPVPSASPSVEPSPSPSVQLSPSPQNSPEHVELSSNPISTAVGAKGKSGPVIIRLDDGVAIEADEAWQTAEGIWYRKRGVVSLLDPKHVKAIEKVPTATPLPTAATQSPSP